MATLDWHATSHGGVTLVRLLVTSEATERVRVTNCLDGPVWPPRRQGVPEEGWDEEGFEGVVEADGRLVLGYATPAEPCEPPARLTSPSGERAGAVTAREVVRTLGDPAPPRDAVSPVDDSGSEDVSGTDTGCHSTAPGPTGRLEQWEWGPEESDESEKESDESAGVDPEAVTAWLDDVETRLGEAERLAEVTSVEEATETLAAIGGREGIAHLQTSLDADRERIKGVGDRCEALAARLEAVEVPVETLERLA